MNVNNVELNNISNKLEFKNTQKSIDNITQKMFGQDAFQVNSGNSKNQLFNLGDNTQEDIQEAAAAEPSEFVKGALVALGNTTTSKDLSELDEEGYDLEDTDVDTIVTVTDKIQIYLATHCDDYEMTGDISIEEIKKVAGDSPAAYEVAKKLKESNLPITQDNVEESVDALDLASQLNPISDGAAKYMINNDLTPTIENIYKAEFSGTSVSGGTYGAGYFSEGSGYVGKTTDEFNWDSLKEQMGKVIESAGLEVNDDTLSDAKWLIENHLPLTQNSLQQYEDLKDISLPASQEEVLDNIIQALQEGKRPAQALLSDDVSLTQRAEDAYQVVQNTTDENIKSVIESELPININNLKKIQESEAAQEEGKGQVDQSNAQTQTGTSSIQVTEDNISLITARRQLEEIRLKMTTEANYKLLKQGISIETSDLQALIDDLKNAEDSYYKQLLENGNVEDTDDNLSAFKEITTKLTDIKYVPNTVLGKVASEEVSNTINAIHASGTALKNTYDSANQSYEALMTKPRSDMGDNISKAFQNVDDILNDMGLETTESNQRAVRILGYNSMEITEDNINAVKAADAAVNNTISNLTPNVVLKMIRDGMNPLDTNIDELNSQINEIKSELSEDKTQEKYSEFLWRMEKNDAITSEERDAFIGMYRLINNVEKTDGQVIGSLVNQNADITLNNLLTGVRNIKNKGINVAVDDNFGELEALTFKTTSISDQLATAFHGSNDSGQSQNSNQESETTAYYNNLVDKALREISPDKLSQIFENGNIKDMSLEAFVDELVNTEEDSSLTKEYYTEQLSTLNEAAQVENNVIKMLSDFDQPVTIQNILAADSLLTNRGSMFKKLLSKEDESSSLTKAIEDISKSITSKEDMDMAYQEFEDTAIAALNEQAEQEDITSIDLKQLKLLRNEIRLTTNLSKEEKYEIPIKIGDELTSINLTVIRGTDTSKVSITMDNSLVGKAAAEFTLKDNSASGYIAADSKSGLDVLKENQSELQTQLEMAGLTLNKVDYIMSKGIDINKFNEENSEMTQTNETSTKDLYSTARAFVVSMQKVQSN
ncbi:DUF6240 domain-containing protein [Lachnotalea glycerini]|uniref:Flagellar hook-length control protein FliK n=1 Tax=Lachnotalea glycerini TaxID=1763509 RepID=A0A371JEY4_9FIRM|nr:DUF6240 domain-containing protein [Lachnotalea glycerini]RDY31258.1 hypothetical protein CG710_010760 [Lachnotalea glycerini]